MHLSVMQLIMSFCLFALLLKKHLSNDPLDLVGSLDVPSAILDILRHFKAPKKTKECCWARVGFVHTGITGTFASEN